MLKPEQFYYDVLAQSEIPEGMHDGIVLYLLHGLFPGSFLRAVLENDLREAVNRADDLNLVALPQYVRFFYNHAPIASVGSPERVEAWIEQKRLEKQQVIA